MQAHEVPEQLFAEFSDRYGKKGAVEVTEDPDWWEATLLWFGHTEVGFSGCLPLRKAPLSETRNLILADFGTWKPLDYRLSPHSIQSCQVVRISGNFLHGRVLVHSRYHYGTDLGRPSGRFAAKLIARAGELAIAVTEP
jgi:hypothetical protein